LPVLGVTVGAMSEKQHRIIIPGGSGFLGRTLTRWYASRGCQVTILSRDPAPVAPLVNANANANANVNVIAWDGKNLGAWADHLDGADAVINLAGRSVNCRYHAANRRMMMDSRIDSTLVLGKAIAACGNPPEIWLNSSTATIYRHRYDAANTERDGLYGAAREAKDAFSLEVAHGWEDAFTKAYTDNDLQRTRGILLRTAIVLGNEPGGGYGTLRNLARVGLGGTMAGGRQFVSWIHERDFCRTLDWLIATRSASGIYNIAAPNPLPNKAMMAAVRGAVGVPIGLPATRWMLEIGAFFLRTETELIFKSRRVVPEHLLEEGFTFEFEGLPEALADLEGSRLSPIVSDCLRKIKRSGISAGRT
jgi:uncharacterized protein